MAIPAEMNLHQVLETLAFAQVAPGLATGAQHNSRIARVAPQGWQARVLGAMADLRHVTDVADCARALADPAAPVLFIADAVTMDSATLHRLCGEAGLDKVIIWEDGGAA